MRDYLKLHEIEDVLECNYLDPDCIKTIMADMKAEANTCLCYAYSSSECTCGARSE